MTILQNASRRSRNSAVLENPFPVESSIDLDGFPETCKAWSKKKYSSVLYKYYTFIPPQKLLHAIKHMVCNYSAGPIIYSRIVANFISALVQFMIFKQLINLCSVIFDLNCHKHSAFL